MQFNFIIGKAKSSKTKYCLEEIKKHLLSEDTSSIIFLVPEYATFEAEKRFLKTITNDKYLRARVISFKSIANLVFTEVGGLTRNHMKTAGRSMLIYRIMNELKDEFKIFSKSASQSGFVSNISDIIKELKRFDISLDKIQDIEEKIEDSLLKDKLSDIKKIFSKFEENIDKKYIDSEDEMNLLSSKILDSSYFDNAHIYIDGFTGFTPVQYKVLRAIMSKCSSFNIVLPTDFSFENIDISDIFVSSKVTKKKMENICKEENILDINYIKLIENSYESDEIKHLENNYFSYPYKEFKKETKDISLFTSVNVYSEVEEVAKNIIINVREQKLRFSDIVVCTRNSQKYSKLISAIFDEYEIPYFLDEKKELKSNSIIVLISSILDIYNKKWSYEAVFRYLKTGLININKEDVYLLENYVLANGIRGKTKWISKWNYRLYNYFDEITQEEQMTIDRINQIKDNIVLPLEDFFSKIKGRNDVKYICECLYEFLNYIQLEKTIENLIIDFKEVGEFQLANEYSQVFDIFIDVLEQMIEIIKEDKLTLDEFAKILYIGFDEYEIGTVPSNLDQVHISSVERLGNMYIKHLYILGVNDGSFPLTLNDEGILNDKDRENLQKLGIELDLDTIGKTYQEQYFVYIALSSPIKTLNLSYAIGDSEGKTLRPSIIISRIKKIFPNIKIYSNLVKRVDALSDIVSKVPAFNNLIITLKNWEQENQIDTNWLDVYNWYSNDEDYKSKLDTMILAFSHTNQVEKLDSNRVKQLYNKNYFSVSRLEKYAQCPFAYFMEYGLKAKERKVYSFNAPDLGSFMHNVLDIFCKNLKVENKSWKDVDVAFIEDKVNFIVNDMIKKIPGFVLDSSSKYKYLSIRLKRVLVRALEVIAYQINEGDFEPYDYEVGFGHDEKYPPIKIVLENGKEINLVGRIDRVDVFSDANKKYIRIVDYKSSDKNLSLTDVYYGLSLQLLIYLDAILKNAKNEEDLYPAGILYFRIDDPLITREENIDDERIKKKLFKELKMKGFVLKDIDIINHMDNNIQIKSRKFSDVIPANLTKEGIGKNTNGLDKDEFNLLRKYVNEKIKELSLDMLDGKIKIQPCKGDKRTSCDWCKFSSICQFDEKMKDNNYKGINKLSNEEALINIKKKVEK